MNAQAVSTVAAAGESFTVLIPARMASSRLPDKPLAEIAGLPMVVRVALQAAQSRARSVHVATDDARIVRACEEHGVPCVVTRSDHLSGSDRLAEAASLLALPDEAIVVNVQGDEPFIPPALIDATAALLQTSHAAPMGTAAHAISDWQDFANPSVVKLVTNAHGLAQYFSRAPIPHHRERSEQAWWLQRNDATAQGLPPPLRHIGIYSYRAGFLRQFPQLPMAPTEHIESLEQLRVLWHGHAIAVHIAPSAPPPGVDTPEDLAWARAHAAQLAENG